MNFRQQNGTDAAGSSDHHQGGLIEMLQAEHTRLGALFDRYLAVARNEDLPAVRERLARSICDTLATRRLAEEDVLYPEIAKEDDKLVFAFQLADEAIAMRIAEIRDPATPRLARDHAVLRLIGLVKRNIVEREQALFRFLRARITSTRMQWLAADLTHRKQLLSRDLGEITDVPKGVESKDDAAPLSAEAISLLAWRIKAASESARR